MRAATPRSLRQHLTAFFLGIWALLNLMADRLGERMNEFNADRHARAGVAGIAGIVIGIVSVFLGAQVAMQVFADVLPDYLANLGTIFTVLNGINTSTWPTLVATFFGYLPLILGILAIAGLFGAGALFVLQFRNRNNAI